MLHEALEDRRSCPWTGRCTNPRWRAAPPTGRGPAPGGTSSCTVTKVGAFISDAISPNATSLQVEAASVRRS